MPSDNAATIAVGSPVLFPQTNVLLGISRVNSGQFILPDIGIYEVNFQVSITEAGQLCIVLNSTQLAYTICGRATGTSQIVGTCLIQTTNVNSVLSINNPTGNSTSLTVTPLAGGANAVSAHLTIKQIATNNLD